MILSIFQILHEQMFNLNLHVYSDYISKLLSLRQALYIRVTVSDLALSQRRE